MKLSRYFSDLRSAYDAELDDLTSDSEGKDVLKKRLSAKRSEIGFLVQMLAYSPEMVAVVFHQAFRFKRAASIERLLALGEHELPTWPELAGTVALEPWAEALAQKVMAEPGGAAFLTVAACLEYLHAHGTGDSAADQPDDDGDAAELDEDADHLSADDAHEPRTAEDREGAGADWLSDVGFERKD